jgi:hypothetical protein
MGNWLSIHLPIVTPKPDESAIPIVLACELTGVSRQLRTTWIERRLVLGETKGMCRRAEVLDLACVQELVKLLGFDDARLAWPQVADAIRLDPTGRLHVVIDLEFKHTVAARTDAQIGAACSHGRLVRVVRLDQRIADVASAYERLVDTLKSTERR